MKVFISIFSILIIACFASCGGGSGGGGGATDTSVSINSLDGTTIEPNTEFKYTAASAIDSSTVSDSSLYIESTSSSSSISAKEVTDGSCTPSSALSGTVTVDSSTVLKLTLDASPSNGSYIFGINVTLSDESTVCQSGTFTVDDGTSTGFTGELDTDFASGTGYVSMGFSGTTNVQYITKAKIIQDSSENLYEVMPIADDSFTWKVTSAGVSDTAYGTNGLFTWSSLITLGTGLVYDAIVYDATWSIYAFFVTDELESQQWNIGKLANDGSDGDSSFGTNGISVYDPGIGGYPNSIDTDSSGNIYVAGASSPDEPGNYDNPTMIKLDTSGDLVSGFGSSGVVKYTALNITHHGEFLKIDVQSDGSIILLTNLSEEDTDTYAYIFKYDSAGSLDTSFSSDGIASYSSILSPFDMILDDSGNIYITGALGSGILAVLKFDSNGALDTTFGTNGLFQSSDATIGVNLALLDDLLLVSGVSMTSFDESGTMTAGHILAIDSSAGTLDTDYFTDGIYSSTSLVPIDLLPDSTNAKLYSAGVNIDANQMVIMKFK